MHFQILQPIGHPLQVSSHLTNFSKYGKLRIRPCMSHVFSCSSTPLMRFPCGAKDVNCTADLLVPNCINLDLK